MCKKIIGKLLNYLKNHYTTNKSISKQLKHPYGKLVLRLILKNNEAKYFFCSYENILMKKHLGIVVRNAMEVSPNLLLYFLLLLYFMYPNK